MPENEKYSVKKIFDIAYAHRLLNYKGKCENLHGHNGKIEIKIESANLDEEEMVADFNEIKEKAGKWLNDNLDHKTILCQKDPLVVLFKNTNQKLFLTEKNPTAEILCKIIYDNISALGLKVKSVKFWETETSAASYKKS
ncbi:MAG: 6-carboxytetrahydropterin synthase [Elusimicrobia bacterium]|nr:6-carboxytetrahydropterin synthase [Elusimicrobiota bacterium]